LRRTLLRSYQYSTFNFLNRHFEIGFVPNEKSFCLLPEIAQARTFEMTIIFTVRNNANREKYFAYSVSQRAIKVGKNAK